MHDKTYNSPSPLQHTASNQSCPKVMTVTTGIIIHFSFCAAASLYSSPHFHEICLYPTVREYSSQVHTELFPGWWCWNECPLQDLFTNTQMYTHVRTHSPNPLILPPVLLSISLGSEVVGVDGCWQGLDCRGKHDGSSGRGRIAVSWDPLEGVIRLLWNLLSIRPSLKQSRGCSQMQCKVQVLILSLPPIASSYLPPTSSIHTDFSSAFLDLYLCFSVNTACSLST